MKLFFSFFGLLFCYPANSQPPIHEKVIELRNGYWFDGSGFVFRKATYIIEGRFSFDMKGKTDTVIDLGNHYIVPPFGEAHNHNVEGDVFLGEDSVINSYLRIGVFYEKNPNILPRLRKTIGPKINKPISIDVVFSNGGLTVKDGHPYALARRNIRLNPSWKEEDGEGSFYHTVHSIEELEAKWPKILADKPDFIKGHLLYSEEFEKRKDDTSYLGWKGLRPDILKKVVEKAHQAGLRVSCHIEMGMDFHYAVEARVDEINHMPGFRPQPGVPLSRYEISGDDAIEAGKANIVVVTTLEMKVPVKTNYADTANNNYNNLNRKNLQLLKDKGVILAIGTDYYRGFTDAEVKYLNFLKVFSNLKLLKMWCVNTPKTIFPRRKIAALRNGYEASFLVLQANPLENFENVTQISLRVKQGHVLKKEF